MTKKRLMYLIFISLFLGSCASPQNHQTSLDNLNKSLKPSVFDKLKKISPNHSELAVYQKFDNGLEIKEEINHRGFGYEYSPNPGEYYQFKYSTQSVDGVEKGAKNIALRLGLMAEELIKKLEDPSNVNQADRSEILLIPTTFVSIDNIYETTSFGRYCSEQLANILSARGIQVIEIRKLENIIIREQFGEYGLSRISNEVTKENRANSIMVGTYTVTPVDVILNVRIIKAENGESLVRSAATGWFNRQNNFLVNYLISRINAFNMANNHSGESSEDEPPIVGITTIKNTGTQH